MTHTALKMPIAVAPLEMGGSTTGGGGATHMDMYLGWGRRG